MKRGGRDRGMRKGGLLGLGSTLLSDYLNFFLFFELYLYFFLSFSFSFSFFFFLFSFFFFIFIFLLIGCLPILFCYFLGVSCKGKRR